jgi:hypothetical protein
MYYGGGMIGKQRIRDFRAWPSITFLSPVSHRLRSRSHLSDSFASSATSVDTERVFSQGRVLLSHVRNSLSAQSTRALMCVGNWSLLGYIKDSDIQAVTTLPELVKGHDISDKN